MGQLTLADLKAQLEAQQAVLDWLKEIMEVQGIKGPWVSPAEAAPLIGISRDRIVAEIETAERLRATGRKSDLLYGRHYFNAVNPSEATRPTWKVHFKEFGEVIRLPPEKRKLG